MPGRLPGARFHIAGLLVLILMAGCASTGPGPVEHDTARSPAGREVRNALYDQLDRWRGTRYRLGGMSRKGIDCSGLTYVVYRDTFDTRLPRTTDEQSTVGRSVSRDTLEPGDLVFFKTGMFTRHVGIYVEDDLFLHASRSSGVRMSSLASDYWRKRYWKARRPVI